MAEQFTRNLRNVTIVHVVVLLLLSGGACLKAFTRSRPEITMPIEFVVEVPRTERASEAPGPIVRDVAPPEPLVPVDKPKRKRKIEVSQDIVSRTTGADTKPKLSQEEIQRLLDQGAKPSDHTNIPSEDARCRARIRDKFYALWAQPSYAEVGDLVAEVSITLGAGGVVESYKLTKRSGNHFLDSSVQHAAGSVSRIEGLTASFLQRHRNVTVSFQVAR